MSKLYFVIDRYGFIHLMSAHSIHKKIMEQSSKSNYNWITSSTGLVRLCNKKSFPREYAIDIKVAILNYFSELLEKCDSKYVFESDLESVYTAYNSLFGITDDKVINARVKFLESYLIYVIYDYKYKVLYKDDFYLECLMEWQYKKIIELSKLEEVPFTNLKFSLVLDFEKFCDKKFRKKLFGYEEYEYQSKQKTKIYFDKNKK